RASTPPAQPVSRGYGEIVRLVPGKSRSSCPSPWRLEIGHPDQCPLRKRQIQQPCAGRKGCAQSNLPDQQERRYGPHLVQREDERKQRLELVPQPLVVETYGRDQVATQGNPHTRRHHHRRHERGCAPTRKH